MNYSEKIDQPGILFGVCGIGNGHTNRQLPLIKHFADKVKMVIFGYGESYKLFSTMFQGNNSVRVVPVEVPFYVGNQEGLDFEATAKHPANQNKNYEVINSAAIAKAQSFLGVPNLVVSDYEPNSAKYAYAHNAPLVTIDQQSKYLWGDFPNLGGASCNDEIARLRMFFPKAAQRIATSFFNVQAKSTPDESVDMYPVILKDEIISLKRDIVGKMNSILIYLSSQQELDQPLEEIVEICKAQEDTDFHIFAPKGIIEKNKTFSDKRVQVYEHGDANFYATLKDCAGIMSTAGHTLLSEAMHLSIPVYAIPFAGLYEQQMNAKIIDDNGFGVSYHCMDERRMAEFIQGIPDFRSTIQSDRDVLLRGPSQQLIIKQLEERFFS